MTSSNRIPQLIVLVTLGSLILAACYPIENSHAHAMAGHNQLSNAIRQANERTVDAYRFAVANPDQLVGIPCYCGCVALGHKNNLDCYIQYMQNPNDVIFDIHAVDCNVCVDITWQVMALLDEGIAGTEIFSRIEQDFSRLGPSTMDGSS